MKQGCPHTSPAREGDPLVPPVEPGDLTLSPPQCWMRRKLWGGPQTYLGLDRGHGGPGQSP
jgi:hypothetical protein